MMMFWYNTQECFVRWCNSVSSSFTVCNGVRQGGVLSPYLYNFLLMTLVLDLLSLELAVA